jgi:hypothetical protein
MKPLDQFAPDKRGLLGRAAQCRTCWNAYIRTRMKRPEVKKKLGRAASVRRRRHAA